jgi:hypothetical protein
LKAFPILFGMPDSQITSIRMPSQRYRCSRPDNWSMPRQVMDPCMRRKVYGPIRPMVDPTLLERLLGVARRS